ncbi:unnamed protein product [Heterobilharzia americana]|nr:unnamed protein product [Heterobilharzia americana]
MTWLPGDICISKHKNELYDLFVVEEINTENSLNTIRSKDYTTTCHSSNMLHITPTNIKLLHTNNNFTSTLKSLDDSYFVMKLNHLTSLPISQASIVINSESENTSHSWNIGDLCICTWSEDEAYYYATILTTDYENDKFTVSFCYYENVEQKSFKDLFDIHSEFKVYLKDEFNKSAAFKKKVLLLLFDILSLFVKKSIFNSQYELEKYSNENGIHEFSLQNDELEGVNEISSHFNQISLEYPISHNNKLFESSSNKNNSEFIQQLNQSSKHLLLNTSNIQENLDDIQLQPLLLSWFMCGYQTGFYEISTMHPKNKKE